MGGWGLRINTRQTVTAHRISRSTMREAGLADNIYSTVNQLPTKPFVYKEGNNGVSGTTAE